MWSAVGMCSTGVTGGGGGINAAAAHHMGILLESRIGAGWGALVGSLARLIG